VDNRCTWTLLYYTGASIIYLSRVLCLCVCECVCVCVCVSQFVAERSAILLVLAIKLTKETRRRVWRGRDRDGEIGKRQIVEGGCEETFHCWSQTWETCRFTVPPAVALLNYISSCIFWRIFCQTGIFAGFPLYIINFAVYSCASAYCVFRFRRFFVKQWSFTNLIYIYCILLIYM